jgi:hypothetical protein
MKKSKHKWIFYCIYYKGRLGLIGVTIINTPIGNNLSDCIKTLRDRKEELTFRESNKILVDIVENRIDPHFDIEYEYKMIADIVNNDEFVNFLKNFDKIVKEEKKLKNQIEFKVVTYGEFENDVIEEINNFCGE